MLGCNRCGHIWDNCECSDKEVIGADRDMFEDEIKDLGSHYKQGSIQPIEVIADMGYKIPFCLGNAIKYIMRCEHKDNMKEDLQKAINYLNIIIEDENNG